MELAQAVDFARKHQRSILTTIRRNGRPQQSNVLHVIGGDGLIRISITADRAKYHNLVREPWAAIHVSREDFFAYAVIEAIASVTPVAEDPHDATVDALVDYYRAANGEHPDWDDYRRAMVADRRALAILTPTHAYGML
ncbi:PPOX class F420-dependent oxidoreductase [Nocardia ninae]|uniref:PPOX class F420-dependent enzyme n=1 Tax=Nocardia ninae NBRC 108245 TaxID=1210091 RepID=A0A511MQS0_9NOCA|nr:MULTISPECIES: PPOX class F420-dependent oxidoreductase [Nocardia]GEM42945.1 PPOX class F420-dependent enzyme [Nocardia ninae NBRC 108245]